MKSLEKALEYNSDLHRLGGIGALGSDPGGLALAHYADERYAARCRVGMAVHVPWVFTVGGNGRF